jgi:hypothetical protein
MSASAVLARTGRDALYVQERGIYDLPFAYMAIAGCSVPMAFGMLALMRRCGPRRARLVASAGLSLALLVYAAVARPGGGLLMTSFFVFVPLAFGVLFSAAWLLTADLLEGVPRETLARAYSRVGAAAIVGGVTGAMLARFGAARLGAHGLLCLAALLLLVALGVMARAQALYPPRPRRAAPTPTTRGAFVEFRQRYAVLLLLAGMAASLVTTLFEFQFYLAAATSGGGAHDHVRFFANLYLLLNGAALVVQLVVMPRLQGNLGVHGSLQVLPAALFAGALAFFGGGSLLGRAFLRVTEGGLRASIHRVNWEQAFLPVETGRRATAKLLVDGVGARVAEGLAALLVLGWLYLVVGGGSVVGRDTSWITVLLAIVTAGWMLLTHQLGRTLAASPVAPDDLALHLRVPDT